jgi:hypothetical protein
VGEVERVTLGVRATQTYYLSVTASVSAATADPNAANNAATTTTAVSSSLGSAAATGDFASSAATLSRAARGRERSVVFTVQNLGAALTAGVALAQNNVADAAAVSSPG